MALIDDPAADPGALAVRLERWLGRRVVEIGHASRANGFSNETWRVVLADPHEVVALRLPPERTGLFPEYDLPRQYGFMQALQGAPGLAIAPCRWLEHDPTPLGRPFYATAWVEGRAAPDRPCYVCEGWIAEAVSEQQSQLWHGSVDQLAALARLRWQGPRLAAFDWPDRGRPRAVQHIAHWDAMARWGRAQLPPGDTAHFDALRDWLLDHRPLEEPAGIVWGDARFGNILFDGFRPAALLDWELAVIGDPMLDIAYLLFHVFLMELLHGDASTPKRFAGFDGDEATLLRWCERTGRSPDGYRWCWLFNAWKMLAIWECKGALLLRSGHAGPDEALAVRDARPLWPHIRAVWQSGERGAFVRPTPPASSSPAPAAA